MVLHLGQHDHVIFVEVGVGPGARHEIDRFSGVAGIDDFADAARVDEARDALTRSFIGRGRLLAQRIRAPMDIGVGGSGEAVHRVKDGDRLLRGGGAVQRRVACRLPLD